MWVITADRVYNTKTIDVQFTRGIQWILVSTLLHLALTARHALGSDFSMINKDVII